MIKLIELLQEITGKSKAIFLAGPAGSGKSYITKQILPSNFTTINVDDTYEELLKASGLGLKQKDFTSDQLAQAAKLMGQAQKATKEKFAQSSAERQNLIIDGTGAASKPLLKKKQELEALGYDCLMVMIYVSPVTSLQRNSERDRSLMPSIILRTWRDVNQNINVYKQAFGDKFILINNDPKDATKGFSLELIKPYFEASAAKGKPKTPEEQAKSKAEREKLNSDIEALVKEIPEFDTLDSAKSKINEFIS
jgi:dephospho-CoA kinase